jgi:hypothetical protein
MSCTVLSTFGRALGKGFFTLKTTEANAVCELMLLSPHRSPAGLCVFQRWILDFDPNDALEGNPLRIDTNQRNFQRDITYFDTNFSEH